MLSSSCDVHVCARRSVRGVMTSHVVGSDRVADMEGRDGTEAGGALPVREMLRDGEWGWDTSMSFMSLLREVTTTC